jgi:hypothetical protein
MIMSLVVTVGISQVRIKTLLFCWFLIAPAKVSYPIDELLIQLAVVDAEIAKIGQVKAGRCFPGSTVHTYSYFFLLP